jgi:cytosine deaminase
MKAGCEIVGGLDPCAIDRDPKGHLDAIFGSASATASRSTSICTSPARWALFSTDLISSAPARSA